MVYSRAFYAAQELERFSTPFYRVLPIYLSPATTPTKSIHLHQVWRPAAANELNADKPGRDRDEPVTSVSRPQLVDPRAAERAGQTGGATGSRCARMTPRQVRRSRNPKSSKDTNTIATSSSHCPLRS